jgi:chromosome segregation ATPase
LAKRSSQASRFGGGGTEKPPTSEEGKRGPLSNEATTEDAGGDDDDGDGIEMAEYLEFKKKMQSLQEAHGTLKQENTELKAIHREHYAKIKSLKAQVQKYQQTYHDIDIGELHRKLQYLESECDVMTRLNTKLTQHIDAITKNNDDLRKAIKQHKERERREKEAAEAAARE